MPETPFIIPEPKTEIRGGIRQRMARASAQQRDRTHNSA